MTNEEYHLYRARLDCVGIYRSAPLTEFRDKWPDAGTEARALLVRWGRLHWVRNLLGAASVATYIACLAAR